MTNPVTDAAPVTTDTLVIGAGPAGLAAGACLAREGVPFTIVERADALGASWRGHYDRLHLHTVKKHSSLPYLPFPDDVPKYPSRLQVIEYLEAYARAFGLAPRFGEAVERARPLPGGGWETRTSRATYRSRRLVVATSYNGEPNIPSWPGQDAFCGRLLHSSRYKNGAAWRGKDALVIGFGNSGGEIAIDLVEHGARTAISVRGPVHIMPRDLLGTPAQVTGILLGKLPTRLADAITSAILRLAVGDLSPYGLRRPDFGTMTSVRRGRIPLIDIGTIALIKRGELAVLPDIERFTEDGVVLRGGAARRADVVVLATGFKARLDRFLEGAAELTDERGYPRWHGREVPLPRFSGLYFIGFANPPSGALREIGIEARRVAAAIARARRAAPAAAPAPAPAPAPAR